MGRAKHTRLRGQNERVRVLGLHRESGLHLRVPGWLATTAAAVVALIDAVGAAATREWKVLKGHEYGRFLVIAAGFAFHAADQAAVVDNLELWLILCATREGQARAGGGGGTGEREREMSGGIGVSWDGVPFAGHRCMLFLPPPGHGSARV